MLKKKEVQRSLDRMQKELSELLRKQGQLKKELEEERKKSSLPENNIDTQPK